MSKHMLDDEDAIDDVNPFVMHDFSLPGGVRQTGDFSDFQEVYPDVNLDVRDKSVYCDLGACEDETSPCIILKDVHPRRNIDTGFTCKEKKRVKVGVSKKPRMSYIGLFFIIFLIALFLVYARY
jgi:hypothetical protein